MDVKYIVVFSIGTIILMILFFGIIAYAVKGNELNNLNNLYEDISVLEDNVLIYYLNNGSLPIEEERVDFDYSINPNDNLIFYKLDLDKLGNIKLIYGNNENDMDFYIINENSHTIYYYKGIKYNGNLVYTNDEQYQYIDLENFK